MSGLKRWPTNADRAGSVILQAGFLKMSDSGGRNVNFTVERYFKTVIITSKISFQFIFGLFRNIFIEPSCSTDNSCTEVTAQAASLLAAGAAFHYKHNQKTGDEMYLAFADDLLERADTLYEMSKINPKSYHLTIKDAAEFYKSWGGYNDEMITASAWTYRACEKRQELGDSPYDNNEIDTICSKKIGYLNEAIAYHSDNFMYQVPSEESWDTKVLSGMYLLMDAVNNELVKNGEEASSFENFADYLTMHTSQIMKTSFLGMSKTPQGFPWYLQWGSARYASNLAFMGVIHNSLFEKYGLQNDIAEEISELSSFTVQYLLGENTAKQSFVVGYKKDDSYSTVEKPHHKSSACPKWGEDCGWDDFGFDGPNPHILYGALVGGPGQSDDYVDDRNDYIKNEVTCDYNAGFTGAVVGLKKAYSDGLVSGLRSARKRNETGKTVSKKNRLDFEKKSRENGGKVVTANPAWMFRRYKKSVESMMEMKRKNK